MCKVPVTLGGGNWILNEGLDSSVDAVKYPRFSHSVRQKDSMLAGSKDLANSMICANSQLVRTQALKKMPRFGYWYGETLDYK